jgi:transcriptional regulator with XRE-family HTH domain
MQTGDIKKDFGATVRRQRRRLGLSQEALAERAGLHRTYLTEVESGVRNVSLESISKLARALNVPVGALFPASDPNSSESDQCPAEMESDYTTSTEKGDAC